MWLFSIVKIELAYDLKLFKKFKRTKGKKRNEKRKGKERKKFLKSRLLYITIVNIYTQHLHLVR